MNEQFKRQAEQILNAAASARIPENVQAFAQDQVAKSREAYDKISAVAMGQAAAGENVMLAAQAGAKALGSKIVENTMTNTEAALDAAQAIAKASSVAEAARLQADFMQRQFAVAGTQTQELFALSSRIAKEAFDTVNAAASKAFDPAKKSV